MITIDLEEDNVPMVGITIPFYHISELQKMLNKDCLFKSVDAYADTSFDSAQCDVIIHDLQSLQNTDNFAPEVKKTLSELIDFCKLCAVYKPGNRVLVFYAD